MLTELAETLGGERHLANVLTVSVLTLRDWLKRTGNPCAAAKKAIWLTWIMILHPHRCQTIFDMATWGRFRVEHHNRQRTEGGEIAGSESSVDLQ